MNTPEGPNNGSTIEGPPPDEEAARVLKEAFEHLGLTVTEHPDHTEVDGSTAQHQDDTRQE
jgi:hypothetical protein